MQALDEDTQDGIASDETAVDDVPTVDASPHPQPLSFTRGLNPRAMIAFVRHEHGDEGVRALAHALPAQVIDDLGGLELRPGPMTWVPFLTNAKLVETIDAVFGNGDLALCRHVGRFMASHDLPVVIRPLARMLSPRIGISIASKLWRIYHSHGSWEFLPGERDLRAVLYGRPENHPAFCAAMCGWMEGAFVAAGATEAEASEERCACLGAPVCSIHVSWTERKDSPRDRTPRPPT